MAGTVAVLALVLGAVFDPSSVLPAEKEAKRTLDQWLAAQNEGTFDLSLLSVTPPIARRTSKQSPFKIRHRRALTLIRR